MPAPKLAERLVALLMLPPDEVDGSELDDVLSQAREEGRRLLKDGQDGEAEPLLRRAEALAVACGHLDAARPLRILLGGLEASRNDHEGALAWYSAVLASPWQADDPKALEEVLHAQARIAEIRQELDQQDRTIKALSQLFETASESGHAGYAWLGAARLAQAYFGTEQIDAGLYFIDQAHQWWQRCQGQSVPTGAGENFAHLMAMVSRALFYERKDYQGALRWAQRALEIAPGEADALRVRGFACLKLEDFPAAADAYRAWAAAEPGNATAQANLAHALAGLGESGEAAKALAEAVGLDPGNLPFRLDLASLLRSLGRLQEAITELDALISIGRERERTEAPAGTRLFRDAEDYQQNASAADQVDLALVLRTQINLERNRLDLVRNDIEGLLDRPDPSTNAAGHHYHGQVCEREDNLLGALHAYDEAVATGRAPTEVFGDRARLLLRLGDDAAALAALEALADPDRDPARAITGLDELLERSPGNPGVLRVRGIAHFHAWHPQAARSDLQAAVEGGESGWRTYRMLGLSLILFNPTDDEQAGISIPKAIEALTEAAFRSAESDDPDAVDAARVLRWLLDRALGDTEWAGHVTSQLESGAEPPWRSALPDITPALLARGRAIRLEGVPDWRAAAAAWEQAQEMFAGAGFPVTAARTSLNIADNLLRLYELDAVASHLETAEAVPSLTTRPLTAGLGEGYAELPGIASFEIDYFPVYGIGIIEHQNLLRLLQIQLNARAGNYAAATAGIGNGEWLFAGQEPGDLAPGVSVPAITGIAQTLRRAGQRPLAAALLRRVGTDFPPGISVQVWATLATLHPEDFWLQMAYLDQAEQIAHDDPVRLRMLMLMRVQVCVQHELWDEAATRLERIEGQSFPSPNDALNIDALRAHVELGRGNPAEAVALIGRVIDQTEEDRLGLTRWALREAWSGAWVYHYELAITAAMAAGQGGLSFEYAERSRSRALLDDAFLADSDVRELTSRIRQARDDIDWLERLPSRLNPAQMIRMQELIRSHPPPEVPRESSRESLSGAQGDLIRSLGMERLDLEKRRDLAKVEALRRQGLNPVTWKEMRAALGAVYLAQYHVLQDRVLLFDGTGEEPEITEIPVDLSEIESALAPGETAGGGFDLRQVDLSRLQLAAAPLVTPLCRRVSPGTLICLIPHGLLHAVPLHVLEVDGEPLGLRNPISYWPSASILTGHLGSDTTALPGPPLVVGDPGGDLNYARVEAVTVARQLGLVPVLGNSVSKRLVLDTLLDLQSPPALVHVAGHGTTDTCGTGAGIVLGHSPRDSSHWLQDDVLTPQDLAEVKLPAALVVLSCCRMAGGTVRPGDELTGLVRAFLAAGAAAIVLSQWSVDDLSTSLLMRELYRLATDSQPAKDNSSLAEALRRAAEHVRSMTRDDVIAESREGLASAIHDARATRTVRVDSAALAPAGAFTSMRAALAVDTDQSLRDAALEAEARRRDFWAGENDEHPFSHPHYWAPFVLVGDWRLRRPYDSQRGTA